MRLRDCNACLDIRGAVILAGVVAVLSAAPPVRAEDVGEVLAKAMSGTTTPAMGILVMRDGKVAGEAVRGVRRNDGPDPVRVTDVWHIGSDAKAMTATMIARLVDRGALSWDTPLAKMLPDLASGMRPEYRSMTLIQLLSHHAGLPHDAIVVGKAFDQISADGQSLTRQRLDYVALALKDPPVNQPGTAFSYSNTGYLIAAAIAERATRRSYEELMRREVFAPLGMRSPGFGAPPAGEPSGHIGGHVATAKERNPDFFAPAGNIYLSLDDWAKFCLDQIAGANGEGRLLASAGYRRMQTALPNGPYGLGWGVLPAAMGRAGPVLTHAGSDGTWYADAALFPKTRSGVLVTANAGQDMGADKVVTAVLKSELPSLSPAQ